MYTKEHAQQNAAIKKKLRAYFEQHGATDDAQKDMLFWIAREYPTVSADRRLLWVERIARTYTRREAPPKTEMITMRVTDKLRKQIEELALPDETMSATIRRIIANTHKRTVPPW